MKNLRKNPHIYQINLMTWLFSLGQNERRPITLRQIPRKELRHLRDLGMDLIWFMGMWQRGPDSRSRARKEPHLVAACRSMLEDFDPDDIAGSPYAVHDYVPDPSFGSMEDLLALKTVFEEEGLFLVLDFVPNHTACDHPWVSSHPERYISSERVSSGGCEAGFFLPCHSEARICIAHGKDPYFPPWTDTAQINYGRRETWEAMAGLLTGLATYCHGLRCDMAMLILKDVFRKTWGRYLEGEQDPGEEFWAFAVDRLRAAGRSCLLLAEVYWGKEQELLGHGFDCVYDKGLYDMMVRGDVQGLKNHLSAPVADQERMIRFLENHDEPRAAASFGMDRIRSAMVIHATLPGMRFWHHGQLEAARIRVPVQLRRAPMEQTDPGLHLFSIRLLKEIDHPVFHDGEWRLCETYGWDDNQTHRQLLAWCWRKEEDRRLIVANFSSSSAQGYVTFPPNWLPDGETFLCRNPLKEEVFHRSSAEAGRAGIYVGLGMGDFHFFRIEKE